MMTWIFRLTQVSLFCCFFYSCQPTTQEMLNRGGAALNAGRYQEAIEIYTNILKTKPKIQTARFNRSLCYAALNNYPKAILDLDSIMNAQENRQISVFINPDIPFASEEIRNGVYYFNALQQRAVYYFSMDSLRLAFTDFQDCIDHNYQVGPNYAWQGIILPEFRANGLVNNFRNLTAMYKRCGVYNRPYLYTYPIKLNNLCWIIFT